MPHDWQARRDRQLRQELGDNPSVQHAVKKLLEKTSGFGLQTRRRLLSRSVRLTRGVAPRVHAALDACRETLGFTDPLEVYVQASHDFQAFCAKSIASPLILGVSSRLLEDFSDAELRFVVGHEVGHAALDHFAIPMPSTATFEDVGGSLVDRATQLKLYVWCRAAEISADRAGLLCAGHMDAATGALLKLASGIGKAGVMQADLEAFASQLDAIVAAPAACYKERYETDVLDCFETHPYSPLRVRALLAYSRSRGAAAGGLSSDELEEVVEADLSVMEPSYLEDPSGDSKRLRRALYCAGMCVAAASGDVSEHEYHALRTLLGAKEVIQRETIEEIRAELEKLMVEIRSTATPLSRAQLVQHATIVAAADGVVSPAEQTVLDQIAAGLGVDPRVIDQTLAGAAAPMD